MKKIIISGSSKLTERAIYWRGYFEGRGYEVIDWPTPIIDDPSAETVTPEPGFYAGQPLAPDDEAYPERLAQTFHRFWKHLDEADVFFLMNEDKNDLVGYIGYGAMSELGYVVTSNFTRNRKVEIYLLKAPNPAQGCYEEIQFWLDQGWVKLYQRPARPSRLPSAKPAALPVAVAPAAPPAATPAPAPASHDASPVAPATRKGLFAKRHNKSINLVTCKKKCLRPLTYTDREFLSCLSADVPAWLLDYIAAPEFQRLSGIAMTSVDYSSLFDLQHFNSVFAHSIGVALILWHFTHDQRQTLAGLFHDIASPSFKHCIDYLNGDSERQESIESRTGAIIRGSRTIMRQLKKDGILPSEIDDYHLYPIADNDTPGLAADRLEYTLSNGLFLFDVWDLDTVKRFYNNLTIFKNEQGLDELGFVDPDLAAEFTERNLPMAAIYHGDKSRASLQFIADIISSMVISDQLSLDDLYTMSEREIIDWILSCGDHTISDAFRNFQRSTSVYYGNTARKNTYSTSVKSKVRYIVPLAASDELDETGAPVARRITELNPHIDAAVADYLAAKQSKYVGFDFDFKPYSK